MAKNRIDRLRKKMEISSLVVTNQTNIRYLVGYKGDNAILFITEKEAVLITDFRYKESSRKEVEGAEIIISKNDIHEELIGSPSFKDQQEIGFEKESILYTIYEKLKKTEKKLVPTSNLIAELRMIKDAKEVENIKMACKITNRVLREVFANLSPSSSEKELSAEIDFLIKKQGGERQAFDTIVATGDNAALPHAIPTDRKIEGENILLFDMGSYYNGYASDMTRTFLLKEGEKENEISKIVSDAQKMAIEAVQPGVDLKEIDRIARDYIRKKGYSECFGHSLGHGVGLSVHELPRIFDKSTYKAAPGMIFSIEPGIYLPGLFGVRIEDLVLVTKDGHNVLT